MRKLADILLLAIFASACVDLSPSTPVPPTAAPTSVIPTTAPGWTLPAPSPSPIRTPGAGGPTRAPIAVQDIAQGTPQPDGTVHTTARVTAEGDLGLGQIDLAYPDKMFLNETATIVLRISPAQQLTSLTPVPVPVKTPDLPSFVYKFSGNIQLYPMMIAELRALQFTIDKPGPIRRNIESSNTTIEWRWLSSPRATGRQDLAIELSIPTIVNGVLSELSTSVLQDLTLVIQVQPPAPTPPPPFLTRVGDSIVNNMGAIAVALIGLIGTLIGILVKTRSDQEKAGAAKKAKKS